MVNASSYLQCIDGGRHWWWNLRPSPHCPNNCTTGGRLGAWRRQSHHALDTVLAGLLRLLHHLLLLSLRLLRSRWFGGRHSYWSR